jgi:hypothetical protein
MTFEGNNSPGERRQYLLRLMNTEAGREEIHRLFREYFADRIPPVPSLMIEMIIEREFEKK